MRSRKNQYTITCREVHDRAAAVVQEHVKIEDHGHKCRSSVLLNVLFFAASRISSIFAACRNLADAPSQQAVFDALVGTFPEYDELQKRLNTALVSDLPKALRRRPQTMAIDLTLIPYHGEPQNDPDEICVSCCNFAGKWGRHGRRTFVYAFWGFQPGSTRWVQETYRTRFGIETSYRQMNEARIRTCSRSPLLRLFFFGLAMILRNIWVWFHLTTLSERQGRRLILHLERLRFRDLLLDLQRVVEVALGITQIVAPQPGLPQPLAKP